MTPEMIAHFQANAAGVSPFPSAPQPVVPQWSPEQLAAWQAAPQPAHAPAGPEQTFGQPVPVALPAMAPVAPEVVQAFDAGAPAPVEPKAATTRKGRPPKGEALGGSGNARLDVIKGCILAGRTPVDCVAFLALLDNGGAA